MLNRVVSIGNWTGQASILQWLVQLEWIDITALVTTTDNGWSSAVIRESLNIPSPGDVRNVINAINPKSWLLSQLLNYRFEEWSLAWTHVGNLIVGALSRIQWSYLEWIKALNSLLNLPARVYPVSNHSTQICAELEDGSICCGERQIIKRDKLDIPVKHYFLKDEHPAVNQWIQAIADADLIVICPGVLGTGIIATLLFGGIKEAIQQSKGKLLYVCNAMTYPSQTDHFRVSDHVSLLESYIGRPIDILLANTKEPPVAILDHYLASGSEFVALDKENLRPAMTVVAENLLMDYDHGEANELERAKGEWQHVWLHYIRHDSQTIARYIQSFL